jgi:hypothetical protein
MRPTLLSCSLLAALVATIAADKWPHPRQGVEHAQSVPASFDCSMRKLGYSFGKQLIPAQGQFDSLYYALDLNDPSCKGELKEEKPQPAPKDDRLNPTYDLEYIAERDIHVAVDGSDLNDGSVSKPLLSIQTALDMAAESDSTKTVVLRGGTHYLADTIWVTSKHSGLRMLAYPGEQPVVSGGVELKVTWKKSNVGNASTNIYVADVGSQVSEVPGLLLNGKHATRARYPNIPGGLETSCGYGCMVGGNQAKWTPPDFNKYGPVDFYTDNNTKTARSDTPSNWFQHYMIGTHGLCSVYDPPVSYWCSEHPSGGGAFAFRTPSGVTAGPKALPNSPYKNVDEAVMFVWRPARWANWMFEMKDYDSSNGNFTFGKGGNQGARGSNGGGDFFIENVMEELDYPGEFFFDKASSSLYLYYNGTGAPPASMTVVVPQKKQLVNMNGTQWNPVKDVKTSGITYTASRYTYMDPHGVPSAGDWALDRTAAVFLQGTEGVVFDKCVFDRIDSNALMVSGYNRNATVSNSEFSYIGGNAVAAWGYTNETATDPGRPGVAIMNFPEAGVDGTDGEHPRYTTVVSNVAREVGLYEKQSSFFVQAKTAESVILGNVFFNGPRAGINANDGFGGGDEVGHNLVFSTCRESGDHGPFNSWDRQPFLTTVRLGKPDMVMQWREIHHNFFVDNYSPQENVDNDDGSCFYHTHDNFLVYGGNGMKNDFGGHDNHHYDNIYAYAGHALGVTNTLEGHEDYFYNNKAVLTGSSVGGPQCKAPATVMYNNSYFTPTGSISECGGPMKEKDSTVASMPADNTIIGWAKDKLGM